MAKCECCGKGVTFGIKVSHSHRRSNRTWKPNIRRVKAIVDGSPKYVYACSVACALARLPALSKFVVYVAVTLWPAFLLSSKKEVFAMALPSDPVMLLSVVNLKLRNYYPTLDALCEDMDADKEALVANLASIGYQYDPQQNQFK